jgi:adenine-specific DNA-methyltransferase
MTNANTSALEREIDQLVYKLYGLTEEEIAIVEGNK